MSLEAYAFSFLAIISALFVFIALQTARIKDARRHDTTLNELNQIGGGIKDIKGTLTDEVLPILKVGFQPLKSNLPPLTTDRIIELLKENKLDSSAISNKPAAVGFGATYKGINVSFYLVYFSDINDLLVYSLAFSSKSADPALCARLLEENFQARAGVFSLRRLDETTVFIARHVIPNAAQIVNAEVMGRTISGLAEVQLALKGFLDEMSVSYKEIALNEYLNLSNKRAKEIAAKREGASED